MARFVCIFFIAAILACVVFGLDDESSKNRKKRLIITDFLVGKSCNDESDCLNSECCTPYGIFGKRCRPDLSDGDYCGKTYIGAHLDRIYRKCPCASGLTCRNTRTILGLYHIFKCSA